MPTIYGTASGYTAYHQARGRTVTSSTEEIEAALLVASEWLDGSFDDVWFGYATGGYTQARRWPRQAAMTSTFPSYTFAINEIPNQVVEATYEAALREIASAGSLNLDYDPLKYKSASVDGAVSVEYIVPNGAADIQKQIPVIGQLMYPLIDPAKGGGGAYSGGVTRV